MSLNKYAPAAASIFIFICGFFLYITTLCPSVYLGDSGELITAAYTLGIPHPTGFPLYLLAAKTASLIPAGTFAFRVNLMSAFFGALIPAFLFLSFFYYMNRSENLFLKYVLPAAVSFLLMISFTLWSQAVIARIYTFNGFLCAATLSFLMYYRHMKNDPRALYMMAFTTGLGAGLHITFIIFSTAIWVYLLITSFHAIKKHIYRILFFILTGFSSYIYIFIRQASALPLKWQDFNSLKNYWEYFTQQQYSYKMGTRDLSGFSAYLSYAKGMLLSEFTPVGLILSAAGVVWNLKNIRYNLLFFVLFLSTFVLMAFYGYGSDLYISFRYFIPSYIILVFYIFLFLLRLHKAAGGKTAGTFLTTAIVLLLIISTAGRNFARNDKSSNYIAYNYPGDMLSCLPDNSYLFTYGDNQIYPIAFYKHVLNRRKDVTIFDGTNTIFREIDSLFVKSGSYSVVPNIITAFREGFTPLYSTSDPTSQSIFTYNNGYVLRLSDDSRDMSLPYIWRLYSLRGIIRDIPAYYTYEEKEVAGTYLYKLSDYYKSAGRPDIYIPLLESAVETGYDSVPVLGNVAIRYATDPALENGPVKTEQLYLKALEIDPMNEYINFNLGTLYAKLGMLKDAAFYFNRAKTANPRNAKAYLYYNSVMKQINEQKEKAARQMEKDLHFTKGIKLFRETKYKEAINEFKTDIKINPGLDRSYFHMGLINLHRENFSEALTYLEKAYQKNPKNTSTLNNLGLLHYRLYNKTKAKKYLEESLKINPAQDRIVNILREIN